MFILTHQLPSLYAFILRPARGYIEHDFIQGFLRGLHYLILLLRRSRRPLVRKRQRLRHLSPKRLVPTTICTRRRGLLLTHGSTKGGGKFLSFPKILLHFQNLLLHFLRLFYLFAIHRVFASLSLCPKRRRSHPKLFLHHDFLNIRIRIVLISNTMLTTTTLSSRRSLQVRGLHNRKRLHTRNTRLLRKTTSFPLKLISRFRTHTFQLRRHRHIATRRRQLMSNLTLTTFLSSKERNNFRRTRTICLTSFTIMSKFKTNMLINIDPNEIVSTRIVNIKQVRRTRMLTTIRLKNIHLNRSINNLHSSTRTRIHLLTKNTRNNRGNHTNHELTRRFATNINSLNVRSINTTTRLVTSRLLVNRTRHMTRTLNVLLRRKIRVVNVSRIKVTMMRTMLNGFSLSHTLTRLLTNQSRDFLRLVHIERNIRLTPLRNLAIINKRILRLTRLLMGRINLHVLRRHDIMMNLRTNTRIPTISGNYRVTNVNVNMSDYDISRNSNLIRRLRVRLRLNRIRLFFTPFSILIFLSQLPRLFGTSIGTSFHTQSHLVRSTPRIFRLRNTKVVTSQDH